LQPLHDIQRNTGTLSSSRPDPASPDDIATSLWTSNGSTAPSGAAAASPYTGAATANPYRGSSAGANALDPARTLRLLERAKRDYDFVRWLSGDASVGPRPTMQYARAAAVGPWPSTPTAGIDDAVDHPPAIAATGSTNWSNRWAPPTAAAGPYTGAAPANPYLSSSAAGDALDPARTLRLLERAKRDYDFVRWLSGGPGTDASGAGPPTTGIDDTAYQPAPFNRPAASSPPWLPLFALPPEAQGNTPSVPLQLPLFAAPRRRQDTYWSLFAPSGALLTAGDFGAVNNRPATQMWPWVSNSNDSLQGHPLYQPPPSAPPTKPSPPIAALEDAGLPQPTAAPIASPPPIGDDRLSWPSTRPGRSAPPSSRYWRAQHGIDTGPPPMDRDQALARTASTRRLASEGWQAGYGDQPIVPYQWATASNTPNPLRGVLWNMGTMPQAALDTTLRTARGAYLGAIGGLAGAAGDAGLAKDPDELARALPEMINVIGAATAQPELNVLPRFPVSTAVRFAARYPREAATSLAEPYLLYRRPAALTDVDLAALEARAREIHAVLEPRAQRHRTTAALSTNERTIVGGGAEVDLEPKQLGLLRDDEVPAKLLGAHAEITVLWKAFARGYTPRALATSRPICPDCWPMIEAFGGKKISPTLAIFPRR
jgi:hypothetical protein